jgi:uncharacterized protein YdeI (YjbR/CyaY-like superfamily)
LTEEQVATFKSADEWQLWLNEHHGQLEGIWLRIAKKNSSIVSLTYAAAVEVALCYGWIDAQKKPESKESWLQRFVSRAPKSIWSKINREKAIQLIAEGRMNAAGLAAIQKAKDCGRWEAAYDSPATSSVPPDLQAALLERPAALAFFEKLDRANRYAVIWRVQTAKRPETRVRRIEQLVEMLARGDKIHA